MAGTFDEMKGGIRPGLVQKVGILRRARHVIAAMTKGAHVARLDKGELREIYALRAILEPEAIRLSCPNLGEAEINAAEATLRRMDVENDFGQLGALNREFHLALYRQCGNTRLLSLIDTYLASADRYVRILLSAADYHPRSQSDHWAILDACKTSDARKAGAAVQRHIVDGSKALETALGRRGLK